MNETGAHFIEKIAGPEAAAKESLWLFALPTSQIYALPLWVSAVDESLLADIVNLQMERRGLASPQRREPAMHYDLIARDRDQQLLLVMVLPPTLPARLLVPNAEAYEVTARLWPLSRNHLTLWREEERLVCAFSREEKLCYCQALGQTDLNAVAIDELRCVKLQLEAQNIITSIVGITLWGDFDRGGTELLSTAFQINTSVLDRPKPRLAASGFRLMPSSVLSARQEVEKRQRKRSLLAGAVALYLCFIAGWLGWLAWGHFQKFRIEVALHTNEETVGRLLRTANRWKDVQPAINPDDYPLELLHLCADALPTEGVRLTLFELKGTHILMTGEARSSRAAFTFKRELETNAALANRRWQMAAPRPLPNDSAQFQIEGTDLHAISN